MSFVLTATGRNFTSQSVVKINGVAQVTVMNSHTELEATVEDSTIDESGELNVTVFNPTPGGGETSAVVLTVAVFNPEPVITSLDPDEILEDGTTFSVTITGTGFIATSQARWEGSNRTTVYNSSTELEVSILNTDITTPGTYQIDVVNPTPGGGTSNEFDFDVNAPSDPDFASVVALLTVEAGVLTEHTGVTNVSITSSGSNTTFSSAQAKFGTQSLLQVGTTQNSGGIRMNHAGDRFEFPGQFTFEGWFYPTALANFKSLFDGQIDFGTAGNWTIQTGSTGFLLFLNNGNFSTGPNAAASLATGSWQHVAITRDGSNVVRIFVNGTLKASATHSGTVGTQTGGFSHLNISRGIASDNGSFIGHAEEIRITKGVCRYTATFTAPTTPFPTS